MLAGLGDVAADSGAWAEAESKYRESLSLRHRIGDRAGMAGLLERLAGVTTDSPVRAAQLIGTAQSLREVIGAPLSPRGVAQLDQFLAELAAKIGPGEMTAGLAAGRRMPLDEAVRFALA